MKSSPVNVLRRVCYVVVLFTLFLYIVRYKATMPQSQSQVQMSPSDNRRDDRPTTLSPLSRTKTTLSIPDSFLKQHADRIAEMIKGSRPFELRNLLNDVSITLSYCA